MITKKAIRRDTTAWFTDPENPYLHLPGCTFQGVIVYEKVKSRKGGVNRIGMAVDDSSKALWWDRVSRRTGERSTMPFSAQPSKAWEKAKPVGFASTLEEALALLFPDESNS